MKGLVKIFVSICLLFFVRCTNDSETTTPKKGPIAESVYAAGIIKSENQYEVFADINGKIETIFVKEGDTIKAGDPLFQLENNNTKLTTENAKATAIANDYQSNRAKLVEAKNTMELAQKRVSNDSLLLGRQQALWKQNIGSKIELEKQELSFESAKVNLKKAKVQYEDIRRQLQLASEQSKNNLKIAQTSENKLLIRSELNGIVYKINVKQGEFTNGMTPMAVLGESSFLVEFDVDELDIVKIQKGQKVVLRMDSYRDEIFEAKINFIYPMMDERTRAFRVEAVFTKAPKLLYPNLTLEANIIINEKMNALTIPANYLVNDSSVMLKDGSIRAVKIGLRDYSTVEIIGGIDENTKIRLPKK